MSASALSALRTIPSKKAIFEGIVRNTGKRAICRGAEEICAGFRTVSRLIPARQFPIEIEHGLEIAGVAAGCCFTACGLGKCIFDGLEKRMQI